VAGSIQEIESSLNIGPALPKELDKVHDEREEEMREGGHKTRPQIVGSGVLMVARKADEIIGAASVSKRPEEDHAEISCFAVLPEWRNNGVGSELLSELEQFAIESGAQTTELTTISAEEFYLKNGYIRTGSITTRNGQNQKYMVKNLYPPTGQRGQV
jgi:ribosomal protein S18 acetylase RimI-like enzyme